MMKYFCCIFLTLLLIGCRPKKASEKMIVDAGSFLDDKQCREIERLLKSIGKQSRYHLFLYTVIAEKYYKRSNYGEYIFYTVSKGDSMNNMNVLLYLSYEDKKIKIHTGNKAREKLTDSLSQIAINRLIPYLSQRKYYDGFRSTINFIDSVFMKASNGEQN